MALTDLLFSQDFLMNAPDLFYDVFPVVILFGTLAVMLVLVFPLRFRLGSPHF